MDKKKLTFLFRVYLRVQYYLLSKVPYNPNPISFIVLFYFLLNFVFMMYSIRVVEAPINWLSYFPETRVITIKLSGIPLPIYYSLGYPRGSLISLGHYLLAVLAYFCWLNDFAPAKLRRTLNTTYLGYFSLGILLLLCACILFSTSHHGLTIQIGIWYITFKIF